MWEIVLNFSSNPREIEQKKKKKPGEVITCCLQKRCSKHQRGAVRTWDCEPEHKWTHNRHRFSEGMSVMFRDYIIQKCQQQELEERNYHTFVECSSVLQPGNVTTLHIAVKRKIITNLKAVQHIAIDISEHHQVRYIPPYKCPKYKYEGYVCQHVSQLRSAFRYQALLFTSSQHTSAKKQIDGQKIN